MYRRHQFISQFTKKKLFVPEPLKDNEKVFGGDDENELGSADDSILQPFSTKSPLDMFERQNYVARPVHLRASEREKGIPINKFYGNFVLGDSHAPIWTRPLSIILNELLSGLQCLRWLRLEPSDFCQVKRTHSGSCQDGLAEVPTAIRNCNHYSPIYKPTYFIQFVGSEAYKIREVSLDRHYHYGYFIHTAAIIQYLDPNWRTNDLDAFINSLLRDATNPPKQDMYFPVFWSPDWFVGHSWSQGIFVALDRKDEKSAIQSYFLMEDDNVNYPDIFVGNKATGVMFENKADHYTYFSPNLECIQGIRMIPATPALPKLKSILMNYVLNEDPSKPVPLDDGMTLTWTMIYVASQ
ncbi:hypothetical protein BGZ80_010016 [Entomortierella chlamydospora]|uniref:glucan endo-1,3-beta-D-glucosidase n=1 Tax=Entomortierella chlamydospora TaxID=101097 RepID=A0A9P6MVF4_9FUNG|nr:hypothetical protein BGZ80_010016 [Entomortierella chlamydospora]